MRVAVTQFALSLSIEENIATCERVITQAASCKPHVIVLPALALCLDHKPVSEIEHNALVKALLEQAKYHDCSITTHFNLQNNTDTNNHLYCLILPSGELITHTKELAHSLSMPLKKVAYDQEGFTKVGLLANEDIATFNAARELTLNSAELLCYSHNSPTLDNSHIHAPTRACENKVFLAMSNSVGKLTSAPQLLQNSLTDNTLSKAKIEENLLNSKQLTAVGQSQIISPKGEVLASLDNEEEGFTFADISLTSNELNQKDHASEALKNRPDGTCVIKQRRPELYNKLSSFTSHNLNESVQKLEGDNNNVPQTVNIALFATYKTNEEALEDVCFYIENNLSDVIQLPELFFVADKTITHNPEQLAQIEALSEQVITRVSAELRPCQYVCTSLVIAGVHQAVIISEAGIFSTQQQLHFCERYSWTELGNTLNIVELPLEQGNINLAMLTADDANIPELVDIAVSQNIHTLLLPIDIQEPSEVDYSLLSKAIEHRICIVAATREKSFPVSNNKVSNKVSNKASGNKVKTKKSTGLVADLKTQNELLTHLHSRKFSGYINQPIVKYQFGKITKSLIHPRTTYEKGLKIT